MTEPTKHEQDLAGFAEQAWAALSSGVVCYGVVIEVPAEGLQSHARGLLDLSAGRFAQQVRTLIPRLAPDEDPGAQPPVGTDPAMDVDVDDTTPQYFADGVLSMPVPEDGGRRRWMRLQGCTAADAGVVPLLWAGGGTQDLDGTPPVSRDQHRLTPSGHDNPNEVVLERSLVLESCHHDSALRELVEQSLRTLGWSDPACRPSARFERLGQWWWAQMHLPAARGAEQADVVMTVTFTAAEAGTPVPSAPEGSGDVPVITPEVFVRVLAADWPDDLPFWPPRTSPMD